MEHTIGSRLKHAWNAFLSRDPTPTYSYRYSGSTYSRRPDRVRFSGGNEKTIVTSVYNRIAMDAAAIDIRHVKLDDNDRYIEDFDSGLNTCLTIEANIDQAARAFKQDIFASMLDEGCVAIIPVDTSLNPKTTNSYDILSMRTGKVIDWKPDSVKVRLYNDRTGNRDEIWLPKKMVAIVENPLYAVINERNSVMQRLIRKMNLLDAIDEQSSSGKLDMIIQLPYMVKTETRRNQAEQRRKDIEDQLNSSKFGIAYIDGTEKVTQLNRPLENNLMKQIEYLTSMLYSQLGITQTILDGTADETTMINYYNRTIEPLVVAVVEELKRKFLTKTARTQKQSVMYFRNMFSLVPVTELAKITDTFTRNEVATSNEMRQVIGWKPSSDPRADQLVNSNMYSQNGNLDNPSSSYEDQSYEEGENQNGGL